MRKQPEILSDKVETKELATMLDQAHSPFATHVNVPAGAATIAPGTIDPDLISFSSIIGNFNNTPEQQKQVELTSTTNELSFGAAQIDLSLIKGALAKNAAHLLTPKHYRDQDAAFKCALMLASRQYNRETDTPIFCFLTQDQTNLINWLNSNGLKQLGLNTDDLVVITAKHSDDLLWAIEETIHTTSTPAIVAHFTLLDNLSTQRLAFAATSKNIPCLLVCNHTIEGPVHTKSQWLIEQLPTTDESDLTFTLSPDENTSSTNWTLKWQPENNKFAALSKNTSSNRSNCLH